MTTCTPLSPEALKAEAIHLEYEFGSPSVIVKRFIKDDEPWHTRRCKNCGGTFDCLAKSRKMFGDDRCRRQYNNRQISRGLLLVPLVLKWRGDRHNKETLAQLCQKASWMLDQDKRAGRPSW